MRCSLTTSFTELDKIRTQLVGNKSQFGDDGQLLIRWDCYIHQRVSQKKLITIWRSWTSLTWQNDIYISDGFASRNSTVCKYNSSSLVWIFGGKMVMTRRVGKIPDGFVFGLDGSNKFYSICRPSRFVQVSIYRPKWSVNGHFIRNLAICRLSWLNPSFADQTSRQMAIFAVRTLTIFLTIFINLYN
jgi:hypothetical protein